MPRIIVSRFILGPIGTNVYSLHRDGCRDAVVIDPAADGERIFEVLTSWGLRVSAILLTHAHFDHIGGVAKLKSLSGAKVYLSELETTLSKDPQANLSADYHTPVTVSPDVSVRDGDVFTEADITFRVISTPGHTEGSCCYYIDENGSGGTGDGKPMLFCGDTLFLESCGRTDMPTGSQSALVRSIREKLFVLPDETRVYPGHMDDTTIGHEKKYNYFV